MNVLMYCQSSVSGGAVSYLRNLVPLLSKRFEKSPEKHSLKFLAHESQKELFPFVPDAQCTWVTGPRLTGWRRILWERRNIASIAQKMNADIVFTPYQIGPHVKGLKQILMIRNMEPFHFEAYDYSLKLLLRNHLLRRQSSRALRGADRVIAVSGFAEEQLRIGQGISSEKIRKVYHGRDAAFSPDGDICEDKNHLKALGIEGDFLLTCGSFLPYRRCEDVIAAFNLCGGSLNDDIKLVIAGSGNDTRYAETIRRTISSSPYRDRILPVGHVSKDVMVALYRRCLACIVATEIEACPNIAIEAMASGCAIISADRPPLPEMFGENVLVFSSRDVEDMGRQIRTCLGDEMMRNEIGVSAHRRSLDFSWEKCADETYAALVEWTKG